MALNCLGCVSVITKALQEGGRRAGAVTEVMREAEVGTMHFEDRGRGHKPRNVGTN